MYGESLVVVKSSSRFWIKPFPLPQPSSHTTTTTAICLKSIVSQLSEQVWILAVLDWHVWDRQTDQLSTCYNLQISPPHQVCCRPGSVRFRFRTGMKHRHFCSTIACSRVSWLAVSLYVLWQLIDCAVAALGTSPPLPPVAKSHQTMGRKVIGGFFCNLRITEALLWRWQWYRKAKWSSQLSFHYAPFFVCHSTWYKHYQYMINHCYYGHRNSFIPYSLLIRNHFAVCKLCYVLETRPSELLKGLI